MATSAKILQLHAESSSSGDALLGASYAVVDSTAGTVLSKGVYGIACPTATPGTWKDLIVAAIITDAAIYGYTVTAANVQWLAGEPGDHRRTALAADWTKDATKTNIGTSLIAVYAGVAGEGQMVDFAAYNQYRLVTWGNKIGTGNITQALMDTTNAANYLSTTYTGAAGEYVSDSGWVNLPAWAVGELYLKPMASSTVSTDDPVFHQFMLYLR